ncbi:hypothetical protein M0802_005269 [Mischocyttarus mexicanus]|nr:hypothetical protein M0802_005269 [Mischocyttarus mexicanus]
MVKGDWCTVWYIKEEVEREEKMAPLRTVEPWLDFGAQLAGAGANALEKVRILSSLCHLRRGLTPWVAFRLVKISLVDLETVREGKPFCLLSHDRQGEEEEEESPNEKP